MRQFLILIGFLFLCTNNTIYAQNSEDFLRPYADKIIKNTAFEFRDKNTNEKFSSTSNLPVKQNLEIESEYLHWSYTSALVYDGLFELGKTINEEKYIDFTKRAFAFFFQNKEYYKKVKEKLC